MLVMPITAIAAASATDDSAATNAASPSAPTTKATAWNNTRRPVTSTTMPDGRLATAELI